MIKLTNYIFLILIYSLPSIALDCDLELAFETYISGDYKSASELSLPCANDGDSLAQYILGEYHYYDTKDYEEAYNWLIKAADQGDPDGMYLLAEMYRNGHHVKKDEKSAIELYELSAEEGVSEAKFQLGLIYIDAGFWSSINRDYRKAEKWFKEAADDGIAEAAYNLYVIYYNGWINGDADKWLEIAASLGHEEATKELEKKQSADALENKLRDLFAPTE